MAYFFYLKCIIFLIEYMYNLYINLSLTLTLFNKSDIIIIGEKMIKKILNVKNNGLKKLSDAGKNLTKSELKEIQEQEIEARYKKLAKELPFFQEVCIDNPIRFTREQKDKFICDMVNLISDMGYKVTVETGFSAQNVVAQSWRDDEADIDKEEWRKQQLAKVEEIGYIRKILFGSNRLNQLKKMPKKLHTMMTETLEKKNAELSRDDGIEYLIGAHYDTPPALPREVVKYPILTMGAAYITAAQAYWFCTNWLFWQSLGWEDYLVASKAIDYSLNILNLSVMGYVMGFSGKDSENPRNLLDNDSGVIGVLQSLYAFKDAPKEVKDKIKWMVGDNEEKFLLGSLSYAEKHKSALKNQSYINLDCIGLGKEINLLHYNYLKGMPKLAKEIYFAIKKEKDFNPVVSTSGIASTSDHLCFCKNAKESVCLLADATLLKEHIHSKYDIEIEPKTIEVLINAVNEVVTNRIQNKVYLPDEEIEEKTFKKSLYSKAQSFKGMLKGESATTLVEINPDNSFLCLNSDNSSLHLNPDGRTC